MHNIASDLDKSVWKLTILSGLKASVNCYNCKSVIIFCAYG